jgi:hypothetical protein
MHSYKLMQRVLADHCEIDGAGEDVRLKLKPACEVPSDSLQNPSDPDAIYDGQLDQVGGSE